MDSYKVLSEDRLENDAQVIEELNFAVDEVAGKDGVIDSLESIAVSLESILCSGSSLDGSGFRLFTKAMDNAVKPISYNYKRNIPSMEMFEDHRTRRGATVVTLESGVMQAIGDAVAAVWKWIAGLFKKIADFFGSSKETIKKQNTRADKIKQKLKDRKSKKGGKP